MKSYATIVIKIIEEFLMQEREYLYAKQLINLFVKGVNSIENLLTVEMAETLDLISNIEGRVIISGIGKSGHIGRKIAATLASTGTPAQFVQASEACHGDMGMITEKDVVMLISNSGESSELFPMIEYCKSLAIPIIGIARKQESTIIKAADKKLVIDEIDEASTAINAPTTSTLQTLVLGDVIAMLLMERRGFTTQDFKKFHPGGKIGATLLMVKDIMNVKPYLPLVDKNMVLKDAIWEMTNKRQGCVGVISDEGQLIGIFTDGDLRRHFDCDFENSLVGDVMTNNPYRIGAEVFATQALKFMNDKKITSMFVVDENDKPLGIIHMHDILKAKVV